MNQTQEKTRSQKDTIGLPPRMQNALEQYQKRVWIIKLAEGTLAAIFGIMISYLVVFGLDRLFDTPMLLRGTYPTHWNGGDGVLFAPKVL